MKKEDVIELLKSLLGSVRLSPEFIGELCALVGQSGFELPFIRLLTMRLAMLASLGALAARENEFESLGNGLFSMHMSGKGFNIRILYAFLPNREPVLLLPFYEREGKRQTDYTTKIPAALERFRLEKEKYENEQYRV